MKTSKWLAGIVAALLGMFALVPNLQADNPPWPSLVSVLALDPDAAEQGSDQAVSRRAHRPGEQRAHGQYAFGRRTANGADYETLPGEVTIPKGLLRAGNGNPH